MTGLEVFLILTGFACICGSFFVSRNREDSKGETEESSSSNLWSERDEELIRDRISEILEECQNEMVDSAEDKLSHVCNEKIMAVDDFAQQLLEKIHSNHQEVVFMYNLLNEKEQTIKKIIASQVPQEREPLLKDALGGAGVPSGRDQTALAQQKRQAKAVPKKTTPDSQTASKAAPAVVKNTPEEKKAPAKTESKQSKPVQMVTEEPETVELQEIVSLSNPSKTNVPGNVNLQIQKLYKEGKSVLEISKALNIGQGEVKLVIALYGGKGR